MPDVNEEQIRTWIQTYVSDILGVPPESIQADANFSNLGLDSSSAVAMVGDLEDWLDIDVDPALPYDFPSISEIAAALAGLVERRAVPA